MKIAIVLPSLLPVPSVKGGAIETLVTGLIDQNEMQRKLQITLFSPFDKEAATESKKYKFTRFIWIRYNLFNKVVNFLLRYVAGIFGYPFPHFGIIQVIYYLKKHKFEYIIIEGSKQMLAPISSALTPSIVYFHLHSATLFSCPEVYNQCRKVIVVSDFLKTQVLLNTERDNSDVTVLKNCIEVTKFRDVDKIRCRAEIRKKFKIQENQIVVCYVGRIDEGKGVREMLEALSLLRKEIRYTLFIVGSTGLSFGKANREDAYYKEIISVALKLRNNVIFTGFIHNDVIPKFLAASDFIVVPSVGEEAQGLTVLEGFAAGLPVVTTDSGGIPENITQECAIMVKRDNSFIQNLSLAIQELILSKEKRDKMGKAGSIHVEEYNFGQYYSDFIDILNS